MYDLIEVESKIVKWSDDRGILKNGKAITQCLKLMSELGELADNLAKGKNTEDDIGDCFVVLTNIARLEGTTLEKCANVAYEDIKDRKGFLNANGNFIKSTDVGYEQMLLDFKAETEKPTDPVVVSCEQKAFLDPLADKDAYTLVLSNGITLDYIFTSMFKDNHPSGPLGLKLSELNL